MLLLLSSFLRNGALQIARVSALVLATIIPLRFGFVQGEELALWHSVHVGASVGPRFGNSCVQPCQKQA